MIDYTHADAVFASLDDAQPATIRSLARALTLSEGPLKRLGRTLECWANHRESSLARLQLVHWLRVTARDEELRERLADVDEPPWPAIREGLAAYGEESGP